MVRPATEALHIAVHLLFLHLVISNNHVVVGHVLLAAHLGIVVVQSVEDLGESVL